MRLRLDKRAVSNVIVIMLSLVLIVVVVGNVVLWSYQMNQFDLERMQEKMSLYNVTRVSESPWFTAQNEYVVNAGSHIGGTYLDTKTIDDFREIFQEEYASTYSAYSPFSYVLGGSTRYISGDIVDLRFDDGESIGFGSYASAFSPNQIFAHSESVLIAGVTYRQLKINESDTSGATLQVDASTTGRKLFARYTYPLAGITLISASTWTFYFRGYKTGPDTRTTIHCDVDILIRKTDGTNTAVALHVANSPNLNRDSYTTVSATCDWSGYMVTDESDFLEIDYYAHVTSAQIGRSAYLRIDDSSLPADYQTRIADIMLPREHSLEFELIGYGDTMGWDNLTWSVSCAFTASSVNTTLQLYNYNLGEYPVSGDGFVHYTSSAVPNTKETSNPTITMNPTDYRDSPGIWKIKIAAIKETTSPFSLGLDWVEYKTAMPPAYRLIVNSNFAIDLSTYRLDHVNAVEVLLRYNATSTTERWFLQAYNWTVANFIDLDDTGGTPVPNEWSEYRLNLTNDLRDCVNGNGTMILQILDGGIDVSSSIMEVDFLGVKLAVDGVRFNIRNSSPFTVHVVSVWMINSTSHRRYDADFFVNSGEEASYIRVDFTISEDFSAVKLVTDRGNVVVFP